MSSTLKLVETVRKKNLSTNFYQPQKTDHVIDDFIPIGSTALSPTKGNMKLKSVQAEVNNVPDSASNIFVSDNKFFSQ